MWKNRSFRGGIAGWILMLAMTACLAGEKGTAPVRVEFMLSGDGLPPETKSVLTPSVENRITSCLLAIYKGEQLERTCRFSGNESLSLSFSDDVPRKVYAFVNMDIRVASLPKREAAMDTVTWRLTSYSALEQHGLPMAGSKKFRPSDGNCQIVVERLMSRLFFQLENEYKTFFGAADRLEPYDGDPSYLLEDLTYSLKNINGALRPFGTSAAGPGDLLRDREFQLTKDGTAVLYVPENCQGDLPAETELTDSGRERMSYATYVETTFRQDPGIYGVGGGLTYRFFLGDGRRENYTVGRNLDYAVRFGPVYGTVMDCYEAGTWNWNVESSDWRDSRYLRLDRNVYRVRRNGTIEMTVEYGFEDRSRPENGDNGNLSTLSCDWRAYVKEAGRPDADLVHYTAFPDFRLAGYDAARGRILLQLQASVPAGKRYEFIVRTADRRHEARAFLQVLSETTIVPVWKKRPGYIAQKASFDLDAAGTRMVVTAVEVREGSERIAWSIKDGICEVSLLRAGPVRLEAYSGDAYMADVAFEIKAPLLYAMKDRIDLRLDASVAGLQNRYFYKMRPEDGGIVLANVSEPPSLQLNMFAPDLYEALLAPVLAVGSGPLAPYLAASGTTGYVANYAPEGMASHYGKSYPGTFVLKADNCPDVEPLPLSAMLEDPFPGFTSGTELGVIRNYAVIGSAPRIPVAAGHSVSYAGKSIEYTEGPVLNLSVNRSNVSFRNTGNISYELNAAGKLVLGPAPDPGAAEPTAGRLMLTAVIRNARTGRTTETPVGRLDCYLFTQIGAILKNTSREEGQKATFRKADIVPELWGGDEVPAFRSLREVLTSCSVIQNSFGKTSFIAAFSPDGTIGWLRRKEQDAVTQADITDNSLKSRWKETREKGYKYKLGMITYSIRLNTKSTIVREYERTALLQDRSTPTYMTCDLTDVRELVKSAYGYHYAYGTDRDASGLSYYVCTDDTDFFIRADEWEK